MSNVNGKVELGMEYKITPSLGYAGFVEGVYEVEQLVLGTSVDKDLVSDYLDQLDYEVEGTDIDITDLKHQVATGTWVGYMELGDMILVPEYLFLAHAQPTVEA